MINTGSYLTFPTYLFLLGLREALRGGGDDSLDLILEVAVIDGYGSRRDILRLLGHVLRLLGARDWRHRLRGRVGLLLVLEIMLDLLEYLQRIYVLRGK